MKKLFYSRSEAREFAKIVNGKVIDGIPLMASHKSRRWIVEYKEIKLENSNKEESEND